MKEPTVEELRKERNQYQAHIDKGGEPLSLTVFLTPGDGTMDISIKGDVPKELRHLKWTLMFVSYIKDKITEAIQPDAPEQGKN